MKGKKVMATHMRLLILAVPATLFAGCASQPAGKPSVEAPVSAETQTPAPTDTESANLLEKKFQEAAQGYQRIEKDGRLQVEYDQQMRDRMRTGARCALGRRGGAGGCAGS